MGGMYWDKNGKKIDIETWGKLCEKDGYKTVKRDKLPNGKFISTVWIGMGIGINSREKPYIFETMVFEYKTINELDCNRYTNLLSAIRGHNKMVKKYIGSKEDYQLYKLME